MTQDARIWKDMDLAIIPRNNYKLLLCPAWCLILPRNQNLIFKGKNLYPLGCATLVSTNPQSRRDLFIHKNTMYSQAGRLFYRLAGKKWTCSKEAATFPLISTYLHRHVRILSWRVIPAQFIITCRSFTSIQPPLTRYHQTVLKSPRLHILTFGKNLRHAKDKRDEDLVKSTLSLLKPNCKHFLCAALGSWFWFWWSRSISSERTDRLPQEEMQISQATAFVLAARGRRDRGCLLTGTSNSSPYWRDRTHNGLFL